MDKQHIRLTLLILIIFVGFCLFDKYWYSNNLSPALDNSAVHPDHVNSENGSYSEQDPKKLLTSNSETNDISDIPKDYTIHKKLLPINDSLNNSLVTVDTDVLKIQINSHGDLIFAELKKYPKNITTTKGFNLLSRGEDRFYIAQSGLLSDLGPDSKVHGRGYFYSKSSNYKLNANEDSIKVDLFYNDPPEEGVNIIKRFIFHKSSYVITTQYIVSNNSNLNYIGSMYGRLRRSELGAIKNKGLFGGGLKTYMGAALNTSEEKYKKISFNNLKAPYKTTTNGGWIAMLEHYFVTAWVPENIVTNEYHTEQFDDNSFGIRFINSPITVLPGTTKTFTANLYVGPKVAQSLKSLAPYLDLTVDYGVLWWLCVPLFKLLHLIFNIIGNWGWSIILTTLIVKLLFYKLSASSYRSMGKLKNLQPKIENLKSTYGEDRQKFSQAIMELYRKEKVNPLGGCLPIIIQIPVFIALYYVLLESVELRQAPWCLWINDLSIKDPFYVLPIVMGISMFIQQKMNPPPADPMQAKVLMIMPVFFTALFLQFPAGLMLYWIMNNSLSILQQTFITKSINKQINTRTWS